MLTLTTTLGLITFASPAIIVQFNSIPAHNTQQWYLKPSQTDFRKCSLRSLLSLQATADDYCDVCVSYCECMVGVQKQPESHGNAVIYYTWNCATVRTDTSDRRKSLIRIGVFEIWHANLYSHRLVSFKLTVSDECLVMHWPSISDVLSQVRWYQQTCGHVNRALWRSARHVHKYYDKAAHTVPVRPGQSVPVYGAVSRCPGSVRSRRIYVPARRLESHPGRDRGNHSPVSL